LYRIVNEERAGLMSEERTAAGDTAELLRAVQALIAEGPEARLPADRRLIAELARLALLIAQAKDEIAGLGAGEISGRFIPDAKDELEAVIGATEAAAETILDAAEAIEGALAGLSSDAAAPIRAAVTHIYEACNFQDITGQRIAKVVRTLKEIEARLLGLISPLAGRTRQAEPARLENGPQLPDAAHDQAEIDAILASCR
jgi:chemotaxis protein CheZ